MAAAAVCCTGVRPAARRIGMLIMDRLEKVIENPLHRYLGATDIRSRAGKGSLTFAVGAGVTNPAGMLHGGVVYLLCDVCAYAGLLSVLEPDLEAVTHDLHVSVLRAARLGDTVKVASEIVKKGKTLCFINVAAKVGDQLIATARITKSLIPARP